MMLEHLGHPEEARRVRDAVAAELAARPARQDRQAGALRTAAIGDRLAAQV
jgi:3-isopropylmalate dehydrogenase